MAIRMTYELDLSAALSGFRSMQERAEDLTPLMEQIGALLVTGAEKRIGSTNEGPDGAKWKPSQRSLEKGGPTLVETGGLLDSFSVLPDRDKVTVGSSLFYAGVHQTGRTISAKNGDALRFMLPNGQFVQVGSVEIPARPFLGISEEDEQDITGLVEDYFDFTKGIGS